MNRRAFLKGILSVAAIAPLAGAAGASVVAAASKPYVGVANGGYLIPAKYAEQFATHHQILVADDLIRQDFAQQLARSLDYAVMQGARA